MTNPITDAELIAQAKIWEGRLAHSIDLTKPVYGLNGFELAILLARRLEDAQAREEREGRAHWPSEGHTQKLQKHNYWGAGEKDCPRDIKAANGELHTLQCKRCGKQNPREDYCNVVAPSPVEGERDRPWQPIETAPTELYEQTRISKEKTGLAHDICIGEPIALAVPMYDFPHETDIVKGCWSLGPHGGIWWDLDNEQPIDRTPFAWAPLPKPLAGSASNEDDDDADPPEKCFLCDEPFIPGDRVLDDMSGETGHVDCFGPDRDSYVKDLLTGEPLGPDDPLPKGCVWSAS